MPCEIQTIGDGSISCELLLGLDTDPNTDTTDTDTDTDPTDTDTTSMSWGGTYRPQVVVNRQASALGVDQLAVLTQPVILVSSLI